MHLSVTYYTGQVAATIHLPERCYLADGLASSIQSEPQTLTLVNGRQLAVRMVQLESGEADAKTSRYLAYFYHVNGREESSSWGVHRSLADVFERNAWFAKIEVLSPVGDRTKAQKIIADFLSYALPSIERCLPGAEN